MISPITKDDIPALLALNNRFQIELCLETAESFKQLLKGAVFACHINRQAFLIAFDQTTPVSGENIDYLKTRFEKFTYVDRIAIHPGGQGKGYGRQLYHALIEQAQNTEHEHILCEINISPPNPDSVAFHKHLGFIEIGTQRDLPNGKTIEYFRYALNR